MSDQPELLVPYQSAVQELRTTLHTTRGLITSHAETETELAEINVKRAKTLDVIYRAEDKAKPNGAGEKQLETLDGKRGLLAGKVEWLATEIDASITTLQGQLPPLQICLDELNIALGNHLLTLAVGQLTALVHPTLAASPEAIAAVNALALFTEDVVDAQSLEVPSIPFMQQFNAAVPYTFPQPRAQLIELTLSSAQALLDAADEILTESQKQIAGDGFSPPKYNPNVILEREQAILAEDRKRQAEALAWNQPTGVDLGDLAEKFAQAAGKTLADLTYQGPCHSLSHRERSAPEVHQATHDCRKLTQTQQPKRAGPVGRGRRPGQGRRKRRALDPDVRWRRLVWLSSQHHDNPIHPSNPFYDPGRKTHCGSSRASGGPETPSCRCQSTQP